MQKSFYRSYASAFCRNRAVIHFGQFLHFRDNGGIYIGLSVPVFYAIKFILEFIFGAFSAWLNITIAYSILDKEPEISWENAGSDDIPDNESGDGTFIKSDDFFIEADQRYNAQKIVETENIRGLDILAVLKKMELSPEVINYRGIRKRLKKLFDDLAFDIDEYVSYEGGKSVEGSASDEIGDVDLEIHVGISKQSDNLPFVVTVKIFEV